MSTKFEKRIETLEEQIKMMRSIIELQNTIIIKDRNQDKKEEKVIEGSKKQISMIKRRII